MDLDLDGPDSLMEALPSEEDGGDFSPPPPTKFRKLEGTGVQPKRKVKLEFAETDEDDFDENMPQPSALRHKQKAKMETQTKVKLEEPSQNDARPGSGSQSRPLRVLQQVSLGGPVATVLSSHHPVGGMRSPVVLGASFSSPAPPPRS
jgi:hypothetical protein